MTDLQMWELFVGFVSATFVLPIIQQPTWSARVRAFVTFAYCVVVGLGTAYVTGAFDAGNDHRTAVSSVLFMLVSAVATYQGFAKPTGIAPLVEHATSKEPEPGS